jgi:hypothetical protein
MSDAITHHTSRVPDGNKELYKNQILKKKNTNKGDEKGVIAAYNGKKSRARQKRSGSTADEAVGNEIRHFPVSNKAQRREVYCDSCSSWGMGLPARSAARGLILVYSFRSFPSDER